MRIHENIFLSSIKLVFIDWIGDVVYFPIWWYTSGLKKAFFWFLHSIAGLEDRLGVRIWIKNIAVPMYGQYDWQGRLISIFMRIVQIIFRAIGLILGSIAILVIFFLWIVVPPLVVYEWFINLEAAFTSVFRGLG